MSEEPIHPNQRKQLITDNIIHSNNEHNNGDNFTFKNNNKKIDDYEGNDTFKQKKNLMKLNNLFNLDNENKALNQIKANVLNFEDIINKRNNELLNHSKNQYFSIRSVNEENVINPKTDINRKLNISQKSSKKNLNKKATKNNNLKKVSKSTKMSSDKFKVFENKSMDAVDFEHFLKNKNSPLNRKIKTKDKIMKEKFNIKTDKDKLRIFNKKSIEKINNKNNKIKCHKTNNSKKNISKNNTEIFSKSKYDEILINYFKFKKIDARNIGNFEKTNDIIDNHSSIQQKASSKRKIINPKTKRNSNKRDFRTEDTGVSLDITVDEINAAIKSKNIGKNIQKRFIPIKDNLKNYDNSKFEKYDTEQIRYELIRDFSNIRPDIGNGFLRRMQFDSLKRNNKAEMLNELVERSKYRLNEPERKKVFSRLTNDANRRITEKKQKEVMEEENNLIKEYLEKDNDKKYNEKEWNKIYQERFKTYEECKKKKVEIEIQKKKIQKMIEEEEEINMCHIKKLPGKIIKENTQRLFDDAKKRLIIKNRKLKEKNKDNIYLTNFSDEDDVSKYMKYYKNEIYNFNGNNSFVYNNNHINFNMININKSFDKNNIPTRHKKKNVPNFNEDRIKRNIKKQENKLSLPINIGKSEFNINNFSYDNDNNLISYSNFKKNKLNNMRPMKDFYNEYSNYNNKNNNYMINENSENENNNNYYEQGNIIDNYLYNYCINRYFDKSFQKGINI